MQEKRLPPWGKLRLSKKVRSPLSSLCEGAPPAGGGGENCTAARNISGYGKVLSLRPFGAPPSQREVFRHAGLPPRGCARRRVSERNRRRRLLARRLKLSPQATDEGKVCHYNPFKGNFRKLAPHPALRATFPRRGRLFHFSKYACTLSSASRASRWPRLYRSSSLFSSPSNRPIVIGSCGRTQQTRPSASSSSSWSIRAL